MEVRELANKIQTIWISLLLYQLIDVRPVSAKTVSQCYQPGQLPFVSLYCGFRKVIQIQRAFHGTHKNPTISHCGYLDGDCTSDVTHLYDWSKCEGTYSCVQVLQRPAAVADSCGSQLMFYLQVHYACIPGTAVTPAPPTTPTPMPERRPPPPERGLPHPPPVPRIPAPGSRLPPPPQRRRPPNRDSPRGPLKTTTLSTTTDREELADICTNRTWETEETILVNPGYPSHYPTDTECRCLVKGPDNTKVSVTYQDLSLVMRGGQCVDWLLLQSLGHKNSAAVTCGQMMGKDKTLLAKGNWLLLHFHSARGSKATGVTPSVTSQQAAARDVPLDGVRNMAGFKVKVQTQPVGPYEIQCYATTSDVLQSLKYTDGQSDILGNLILQPSGLEGLTASEPSSGSRPLSAGVSLALTAAHVTFVLIATISWSGLDLQ